MATVRPTPEQVRARMAEALAGAARTMGRSAEEATGPAGQTLLELDERGARWATRVRDRLALEGDGGRLGLELGRRLHDLHVARFEVRDQVERGRVRRAQRLDEVLRRAQLTTGRMAVLEQACGWAAEVGGFARVMLSRVEVDHWTPWRAWEAGGGVSSLSAWVRSAPHVLLRGPEAQVVGTGESQVWGTGPSLYGCSTADPWRREVAMASGVVAPVWSAGRVVALLHAAHRSAPVGAAERDLLDTFARGFSVVHEREMLSEQVRRQRVRLEEARRAVGAALSDLEPQGVEAARALGDEWPSSGAEVPRQSGAGRTGAGRTGPGGSRAVSGVGGAGEVSGLPVGGREDLSALLTARELEVLALMATGATNERIAQRLVIAVGTVKSHVKQVLRKLGAENRTEAISQYLHATISAG